MSSAVREKIFRDFPELIVVNLLRSRLTFILGAVEFKRKIHVMFGVIQVSLSHSKVNSPFSTNLAKRGETETGNLSGLTEQLDEPIPVSSLSFLAVQVNFAQLSVC